jgi:hypothetical protein
MVDYRHIVVVIRALFPAVTLDHDCVATNQKGVDDASEMDSRPAVSPDGRVRRAGRQFAGGSSNGGPADSRRAAGRDRL